MVINCLFASATSAKSGGIQDAVLVLPLRVCPDDQTASAIEKMTYIPGGTGTPYGKDCILTLGGQRHGEPEALSLLSLEPEGPDDVLSIPWFGNVIAHTMVRTLTTVIMYTCFCFSNLHGN